MAAAAGRRLGWIALGIYIERMSVPPPLVVRAKYKNTLEWKRITDGEYKFSESIMEWADDYRMALYPNEFIARLEAIDESTIPFHKKELQKALLLRKLNRARVEIEGSWKEF